MRDDAQGNVPKFTTVLHIFLFSAGQRRDFRKEMPSFIRDRNFIFSQIFDDEKNPDFGDKKYLEYPEGKGEFRGLKSRGQKIPKIRDLTIIPGIPMAQNKKSRSQIPEKIPSGSQLCLK